MQREDINTDLLWTTNSPVQTMTPDEIHELTNPVVEPQQPLDVATNGDSLPDV